MQIAVANYVGDADDCAAGARKDAKQEMQKLKDFKTDIDDLLSSKPSKAKERKRKSKGLARAKGEKEGKAKADKTPNAEAIAHINAEYLAPAPDGANSWPPILHHGACLGKQSFIMRMAST